MELDFLPPLIIFSFMLGMTWMILNYFKFKIKHKESTQQTENAENSLHTSELKALMFEAVEEATQPLADRIEALEAALRQPATPRLPAPEEASFIDELESVEEEMPHPARRRRVT